MVEESTTESALMKGRKNNKCKSNRNTVKNPPNNHEFLLGGENNRGYSKELSVFHININKNVLNANKLDVIQSYTKIGADIIFIYEPHIAENEEFPETYVPTVFENSIKNIKLEDDKE